MVQSPFEGYPHFTHLPEIGVVKDDPEAQIPVYQHFGDSGADLCSIESVTITPGGTSMVSTGLCFEIPPGFEMQVRSRSGLASKHGVFVLNSPGTVDSGYRGVVKVILHNTGARPYAVSKGDRVAQAVIVPIAVGRYRLRKELSLSARGAGGYGSTGV